MEMIKRGLAPEGILRTLGPGPWDTDPGFGPQKEDPEVILEHEWDEDITFNNID